VPELRPRRSPPPVGRLQPASVCHRFQPVVDGPTQLFYLPSAFSRLQPGLLRRNTMSSHVYHEIYLHFNWHTKGELPLLTGDLEGRLR
jgi:hypothetical protein